MLFGSPSHHTNLAHLHPSPIQIFRLWQTFLENVNPVVKIFHAPSVQRLVLENSGNIQQMPRNVEALMFAIYSCAVTSSSEEECESMHGESRSTLTQRYRKGAEEALFRVNVLKTSDLMVLQAFILFLVRFWEEGKVSISLPANLCIVLDPPIQRCKLLLDSDGRSTSHRATNWASSRWCWTRAVGI